MRITEIKLSLLVALIIVLFAYRVDAIASPPIQENDNEGDTITFEKADLQILIEKAVSKRIQPLQRELVAMKEEIRLHDILGGIGYIVGITGVAFYFLGIRRREKLFAGDSDNSFLKNDVNKEPVD